MRVADRQRGEPGIFSGPGKGHIVADRRRQAREPDLQRRHRRGTLAAAGTSVRPMAREHTERRALFATVGFAEAPRWHDDRLWVSDMARQEIVAFDQTGAVDVRLSFPGIPSGLGWLPDGSLLAVSVHDRTVLRLGEDGFSLHADLSGLVRADLNDMVVDCTGCTYVGNLGYVAGVEERASTGLVRILPDGTAAMQPGKLFRPNGMVITKDRTLIAAETRSQRLSAFDLAQDGSLSAQQTFAMMPKGTWSDGICLDAAGGVWMADPKANQCLRVVAGGEITDVSSTGPTATVACRARRPLVDHPVSHGRPAARLRPHPRPSRRADRVPRRRRPRRRQPFLSTACRPPLACH